MANELAEEAVASEPVSAFNSLLIGKIQGISSKSSGSRKSHQFLHRKFKDSECNSLGTRTGNFRDASSPNREQG